MSDRVGLLLVCSVLICGCSNDADDTPTVTRTGRSYDDYFAVGDNYKMIRFFDGAESNQPTGESFPELQFVNSDGTPVKLADFVGDKSAVVVITRGYPGSICVFCSTQTSRLAAQYNEFAERNAEILCVFPVKSPSDNGRLDEFVESVIQKVESDLAKVPFPVLLDPELKNVDTLGLRRDLARPATYILDAEGKVRFAYVGNDVTDRPSVEAMLKQLDAIQAEAG